MALPKQAENFPEWYQQVVKTADLAEPSLVRGTMVIKPYGFALWEFIQKAYDDRIKATGHQNVYFPLFIPYKLLEREAEHVEGFAPEVAVITHAGGSEVEEPFVVRPTSETIIWDTYSKWVQSYRDLPLLYNQWCNVVRWEKRPRMFLRTTEFLWQEGHTAHETADEAIAEQRKILDEVYVDTAQKVLAMPVIPGRKSETERFAGAVDTMTMECLMRDRKALQAGTSHYLGQNFAKAYNVRFQSRSGELEYAFATSWGVSTRLIGGVIMTHGDDRGLRLPPHIAPIQVVIVPIYRADPERAAVLEAAQGLARSLEGIRVKIDDRDEHRPGYKFNEWELKGVPIRIELGPRDIAENQAPVARRDTGVKQPLSLSELPTAIPTLLQQIQANLFAQAEGFRNEHTFHPGSYDEMRSLLKDPGGFMIACWCLSKECEAKVKAETKATIRYLPLESATAEGNCIVCGNPAADQAAWAEAY